MIHTFDKYTQQIEDFDTIKCIGTVTKVDDLIIESLGPRAVIGELCEIVIDDDASVLAEVVALDGKKVKLMGYTAFAGLHVGAKVVASGQVVSVPVGDQLLGRVINSLGHAIDGKQDIYSPERRSIFNNPPNPMTRVPIVKRIVTGIRAIDGFLAVGRGQRLGVFSGSGVGKSTIQGMIARNTDADVNVIAFIGERGREVMDFIRNDLGPEGLKKSVIVSSTSDTSPLARLRGAYTATAIAEYFRDRGKHVMLLFDSVTRFAKAQREIGLSANEPPTMRGYPPSVFEKLPKLLERAGNSSTGSITAFYTVLVDGDDFDEPISDAVRGTVDGHIILSRELAERGHYPAIDILASISRLAHRVSGPKTNEAVLKLRQWYATYKDAEDMINSGTYQSGSSPGIDEAIKHSGQIIEFLQQGIAEPAPIADTLARMSEISGITIPESEYENIGVGPTQKFLKPADDAEPSDTE